MTAALGVVVGYLLVWQRGFYLDDYFEAFLARDAVTGLWQPDFNPLHYRYFPVRTLRMVVVSNLQGLVPQQELLVREICASVISANAGLLGWFIYRMVRSRLAAVVTCWSFVLPFWAHEAVLWLAAIQYAFGAAFSLLFLHCCWSVVSGSRRPLLWIALGAVSLLVSVLLIEVFVAAPALIPFLALIAAVRRGHPNVTVARFGRLALALAVPACVLLAAYVLIYRSSPVVAARGNLHSFGDGIPSIPARGLARLDELKRMTIDPDWGSRIALDAARVGMETLVSSTLGTALGVAIVLALAMTVITWRRDRTALRIEVGTVLALAALGIAWITMGSLIPYVPLQLDLRHSRLLYFPLAGFAVTCGAIAWLLSATIGGHGQRVALTLSGLLLLGSAVTMLGHASAYQARHQRDVEQIRAVLEAVPKELLPSRAVIALRGMDERLFGQQDAISGSVDGVLENEVFSDVVLQQAYGHPNVLAITATRWSSIRFRTELAQLLFERGASDKRLHDLSRHMVVIQFRDGQALPVESLSVIDPDGTRLELDLAIGQQVRMRGLPTLKRLELDLRH